MIRAPWVRDSGRRWERDCSHPLGGGVHGLPTGDSARTLWRSWRIVPGDRACSRGQAFAGTTRPTVATCTTLSGDVVGGAIYSGCTDTQATGGGGTTVAGSISTTWNTGLTSIFTVPSAKELLGKKDKCTALRETPMPYERFQLTTKCSSGATSPLSASRRATRYRRRVPSTSPRPPTAPHVNGGCFSASIR